MVWTYDNSERMFKMVERFADVMGQVGLFNFTVNTNGIISGSIPQRMLDVIPLYPRVNWLLTIQNLNTANAVVEALLDNTNGARDTFFSEMQRLLNTYPQCNGIDIDLENCGGYENRQPMRELIAEIYNWCHTRGKLLNICMPPITGPNVSIGGEHWCAYEDYKDTVDTMTIMSYTFAWLGSAPGPVSPKWWLEQILEYSTRVVPKEKILLGIGVWALMWGLHQPYDGHKATSGTYYWPLEWMQGKRNFFDFKNGEGVTWPNRQPYISFAGYWSDYEKVCYMMPHVYDYINGDMCDNLEMPLVTGVQDGRNYIVGLTKNQKINGNFSVVTECNNVWGSVDKGNGYITSKKVATLSSEDQEWLDFRMEQVGYEGLTESERMLYQSTQPGTWEYTFTIPTTGQYTLALDMNYPWFDSNAITIQLDGTNYSKVENRFWNITFRNRHKEIFYQGTLRAGTHTVKCGAYGSTVGVVVYGLCYGNFTTEMSAGQASYTMSTQKFIDINGQEVVPADNYAMTIETLRTPPDSANIWYEDYRGYSDDGSTKYSDFWITSGTAAIVPNEEWTEDWAKQPQKLQLSGTSVLKQTNWSDVHIYAKWKNGSGRVGVTLGSLFACMNYNNNQLQLWDGETLVHALSFTMTGEQAIAMRVRSGSVRVYTGTNKTLRFKVNTTTGSGSPGIRSTASALFTLCRIGSGWWYEPYECYEMTVLGQTTRFGRITRSGVTWDEELQFFRVNDDVDEINTRTEDLSLDYDFQYMGRMPILKGKEYTDIPITYKPIDINIRHMRTYIGDADGFGIMYYEDADVLQYWYNRALFEYGIKGICMWSLGQEDCRIWERIERKED